MLDSSKARLSATRMLLATALVVVLASSFVETLDGTLMSRFNSKQRSCALHEAVFVSEIVAVLEIVDLDRGTASSRVVKGIKGPVSSGDSLSFLLIRPAVVALGPNPAVGDTVVGFLAKCRDGLLVAYGGGILWEQVTGDSATTRNPPGRVLLAAYLDSLAQFAETTLPEWVARTADLAMIGEVDSVATTKLRGGGVVVDHVVVSPDTATAACPPTLRVDVDRYPAAYPLSQRPQFEVGQRVLLLLDEEAGEYRLHEGYLGCWRVDGPRAWIPWRSAICGESQRLAERDATTLLTR
ncbi:MAG: hypothetical protein KC729_02920 [Candidatus Eisenbacteria bacterium]|uniref:Uncharacterized protein n=1 Tax=Eiseniibacteriota bacterium TaxID=2212470 RepID=A0A956LYT6_UNCEI|nr:hypothetical protein [Candidatus Eisenbacteria bacterium]